MMVIYFFKRGVSFLDESTSKIDFSQINFDFFIQNYPQSSKSAKLFDFIPRSFMMPAEYQDFCQAAAREKERYFYWKTVFLLSKFVRGTVFAFEECGENYNPR